ncbi:MAG: acetyl-CoA C-acyltransferase [Candidatus Thiodiazotropha sp. (ex Monitilora ramsayi)]|nr:acetyl-CoA C-acyltransferase [Candidatus Thiodiazotropha sp. (ex Monitilora ramsayi)]
MNKNDIVIIAAKRTPIGSFQGQLASLSATQLGSCAIRALLDGIPIEPVAINEVFMGCVLQAGLGQAPARQAARGAGVPDSVGCTTVNKACGSGMKAIMLGHDLLHAGSADLILAGGMESMSNAPYLLPGARAGYRTGHRKMLDHMIHDGLQNVEDGEVMGYFAERCADRYQFTREAQDAYATASVQRAREAVQSGSFRDEICSVTVKEKSGQRQVSEDEEPLHCRPEKIAVLKPAFRAEGGTVTAASSAAISDGAAALLLTRADIADELNIKPLARIIAHSSHANRPEDFTTAPIPTIQKLYEKIGWSDADVDLYEINEAFAAVVMAAMRDLELDHAKVNVNGGACALGHPIGATGARLVVTLLHALQQRQHRRGIAALCIGGGEATALALELGT